MPPSLASALALLLAAGSPAAEPAPRPAEPVEPRVVPALPPPPVRARPVPSAAVAERLAQGEESLTQGNARAALFTFLEAAYLEPALAEPRVGAGRAYLALGERAAALDQAELALALDPSSDAAAKLREDAGRPSDSGDGAQAPGRGAGAESVEEGRPAPPPTATAAPAGASPTGELPEGLSRP